jgi:hypothetical protein
VGNLNLSGQAAEASDVLPKLLKLKQLLDQRKDAWSKIPRKKKKAIIQGEKDPVLTVAFTLGQYLQKNFPELVEEYNGV